MRRLLLSALVASVAMATPMVGPLLPLEPTVAVEPVNAYQYSGSLFFTGTEYALGWFDVRSGSAANYVALLTTDGGVRLSGNRPLTTRLDYTEHEVASLCARGGELWWVTPEAYSGRTSVVRTTNDLVRTSRVSVPLGSNEPPRLACGGPDVLWLRSDEFYNPSDFDLSLDALLADGGTASWPATSPLVSALHLGDDDRAYDMGWRAPNARFVWADGRNGTPPTGGDGGTTNLDLYSGTFNPQTGVFTQSLLVGGVDWQTAPRIDTTGPVDAVVYTTASNVNAPRDVRLITTGAPIVVAGSSLDEDDPHVVWDGTQWVVLWRAQLGTLDYEVRAATVSASLVVGPVQTLGHGFRDSLLLASEGSGRSLASWRDFDNGIHHLVRWLTGATPRGTAELDPTRTGLSQRELTVFNTTPGNLAVSWVQQSQQVGRPLTAVASTVLGNETSSRFASDGTRLVSISPSMTGTFRSLNNLGALGPTFDFSQPNRYGDVSTPVWSGGRAWFATVDNTSVTRLISVDPSGALGPQRVLGTDTGGVPTVAANAAGVVAVARSQQYEAHATCLQTDGGLVSPPLLDVGAYLPRPTIASDGARFFMVYVGDRPGVGYEVRGLFLDAQCQPQGAPLVLGRTEFWDLMSHDVLWDGRQFVVAYTSAEVDALGDVRLVLVQTDAGVGVPFDVAAQPGVSEQQPVLGSDQPGHWLVGYLRFDGDESVSALRAVARWVQDDALVVPDAGVPDAGVTDAGITDAGLADAGELDAGAVDAGDADAGVVDGGSVDAGSSDAGVIDGGDAFIDGGEPTPHRTLGVGCGCQSVDVGSLISLVLLALITSRRRSTS